MDIKKEPAYKRVLLKLSGEAISAKDGIIDHDYLERIACVVKECMESGVQFGIVCGAGNIWRGRQGGSMQRSRADHMGMLATVINSLAIQDAFERIDVDSRVMTAVPIEAFCEYFERDKAVRHLEKGRPVILAAGMGNPYFSTDTAAVLRAAEIGADVVLMAKNIDAIYTADPKKDPSAKKLEDTTYDYLLENNLKAIDICAAAFARDNDLKLHIFGLDDENKIKEVVMGAKMGTVVHK